MTVVDVTGIEAVIDSAARRDEGRLKTYLRDRLPKQPTDEELEEACTTAMECIQLVPTVLKSVSLAGKEKGLSTSVEPLLQYVVTYFVAPIDLIPEMTQGLAGLLDDTYLALKLVHSLNQTEEPLEDANYELPLAFLESLIGSKVAQSLDNYTWEALKEIAYQAGSHHTGAEVRA